ncbi:hypothetical protein H7097_04190 [Aeromicrobium sp.]|nr:hypothetical protein [Candidatus Saccharibacteria bacterium]
MSYSQEVPRHIPELNGISPEDRKRIAEHLAEQANAERELLELMGADETSPTFALDDAALLSVRAVGAVSRDLHGLERARGSDPSTSPGTFSHRL